MRSTFPQTQMALPEAFAQWVRWQASADSLDLVLFFGFAGRKLQRLASDLDLCFARPLYLPMDTAHVMLADTHLAGLVDMLPCLAAMAHGYSVQDFFARLGIPLPGSKFLHEIGLPESTVVEGSTEALFVRFLYAYRWELFKACREKRRELFQYFLRSGVANGMRIGIVDLGWSGDTQRALSRALEAMFDVKTYAYCFCLPDTAEAIALRDALPVHAMISGDNFPTATIQKLLDKREEMKIVFTGLLDAPAELQHLLK